MDISSIMNKDGASCIYRAAEEGQKMKELQETRQELDQVDREIVALFEKRMLLCREVAQYKIAHGMPVLDRSREELVLQSRSEMLEDPYWTQSVRALFEGIMALSRAEQEKLLAAQEAE